MNEMTVDFSLVQEMMKLKLQLSKLRQEKLEISEGLENIVDEISTNYFQDLANEIKDLEIKIKTLEAIKNDQEQKETYTEKRKKDKSCKDLYREISKRTHPDKVGSEKFIDAFREATDAYNSGDKDKLEQILASIDGEHMAKYQSLDTDNTAKKIESLKIEIQKEEVEIQVIKQSTGYKLKVLHESEDILDQLKARKILSDLLHQTVIKLHEEYKRLKKRFT